MTDSNLAVIVLGAGQGTRMKSARPKVLHLLAGVPIVGHVLATARELDPAHVVVVVRHERDAVALGALLAAHRAGVAAATLLSAIFDDATGYGRIIRTPDGAVDRIVEQKDAT